MIGAALHFNLFLISVQVLLLQTFVVMRSIHYLYPGHGAYEYQVRINSSYNMSFSLDFRRHRIHTAEKIMKRAFEAPGSVT